MTEALHFQNSMIYYIPWIIMIIVVIVQVVHYSFFSARNKNNEGQEEITWWSKTERIMHLILMLTFVIMAITGMALSISPEKVKSGIMQHIRSMHHIGPVFAIAILAMLIVWIRFALFKRYDFSWFRHFGGYLGYNGELRSGKFNAGQKLMFWIAVVFGIGLGITGGIIESLKAGQSREITVLIHIACASVMIGMLLVHLYMSVFVVKGSLKSIFTGRKNRQTARKLHPEAPVFNGKNTAG